VGTKEARLAGAGQMGRTLPLGAVAGGQRRQAACPVPATDKGAKRTIGGQGGRGTILMEPNEKLTCAEPRA